MLSVLAVAAYSAGVSFGLLRAIALVAPLRAERRAEGVGLDVTEHGEEAYNDGEGAVLVLDEAPSLVPTFASPVPSAP